MINNKKMRCQIAAVTCSFPVIKDYILTQFHIYVYIYLVTDSSLQICS